jgi:hypothetical protein
MLKLLALGLVIVGVIVALGYLPTKRMGGPGAVTAMLAGCAISFVASIVGSIPIVAASRGPKRQMPTAVMLSTALRFLVVLVLALSAALSGWFERAPLLIWVAISYILLLAADTVFAVRLAGTAETPEE